MPRLEATIDTIDNVGGSIIIDDFSGGLNTTVSNEKLKDNEATIRKNWGNATAGAIEKVSGFTKKNSTLIASAPIRGLFRTYKSNGTKHLLAVCNGKLYYSTDSGTTFTQATNGTGLTETVFNTGVNYNDLFFFTNSTDNLKHYTPGTTTMAAATSQPADPCKVLLKRSDRRFIALVNATNGSTLYFSKIDPTGTAADDWSATNDAGSIAIDGAKAEPLTGGMVFAGIDIIFKHYAAFKVWGYPAPVAVRMPGSPGCIAPYSVAQGLGLGFHLARDGVYMYDGNKFINISTLFIDDITDDINPAYIQNTFGVVRDGLYWLFYTSRSDTVNKKCVIYDIFQSNPYSGKNIWYERDGLEMTCPVLFDGADDDNELYAGDSASTGFVYRLDYSSTGDDNGSNIAATYQTKYFDGKIPNVVKRWSKIKITYFNNVGSILFNWYTDRGAKSGNFGGTTVTSGTPLGSFILDTHTLAGALDTTHIERLPDNCIGKDFSIKISHTDVGTAPLIKRIAIEWEALFNE